MWDVYYGDGTEISSTFRQILKSRLLREADIKLNISVGGPEQGGYTNISEWNVGNKARSFIR